MREVLCSVFFCVLSLYTAHCCTGEDMLRVVHESDLGTLKNCSKSHDLNNKPFYWREALRIAVQNGDLDIIRFLVEERHIDIDSHHFYGPTALQVAIENKRLNVVKLLVQLGANVNLKTSYNTPYAIFTAIKTNATDIVRFLLEIGADPYFTINESTILHQAVLTNNADMVREVIRYKELINAGDNVGLTPIELPTIARYQRAIHYKDVIKVLVEGGSKVPDELIWAFWDFDDDYNVLKLLVKKSGKVDVREIWDARGCRETLLMKMLLKEKPQYDMIKFLIDQGADVKIVYCNNETALHRAASLVRENVTQVIQMLLDHGADINAINSDGFTPLEEAARKGHKEVVEYLSKLRGVHTQSREDISKAKTEAQKYLNIQDNVLDPEVVYLRHDPDFKVPNRFLDQYRVVH